MLATGPEVVRLRIRLLSGEPTVPTMGDAIASARRLAGLLYVFAGSLILMGIITAEALYPATYTTAENEISDLGATRPPDSIILQPSATIFNATMIVAGLALIAAAALAHRAYARRGFTLPALALGIGVLGVGIFPGNVGTVHPLFSLLAFLGGGVAAIASARLIASPMRWVAVVFGVVALAALFGSGVLTDGLGDGGTERWVAYPVLLWTVAFGGWLLGGGERPASANP